MGSATVENIAISPLTAGQRAQMPGFDSHTTGFPDNMAHANLENGE
jgi:hypothetical protein